jgi:hypothetical protein
MVDESLSVIRQRVVGGGGWEVEGLNYCQRIPSSSCSKIAIALPKQFSLYNIATRTYFLTFARIIRFLASVVDEAVNLFTQGWDGWLAAGLSVIDLRLAPTSMATAPLIVLMNRPFMVSDERAYRIARLRML